MEEKNLQAPKEVIDSCYELAKQFFYDDTVNESFDESKKIIAFMTENGIKRWNFSGFSFELLPGNKLKIITGYSRTLTLKDIEDVVKEVWDENKLKYDRCFDNLLKYGIWTDEIPFTKEECYEQED